MIYIIVVRAVYHPEISRTENQGRKLYDLLLVTENIKCFIKI